MMVSYRNLLFQGVIFRCHVCFREGKSPGGMKNHTKKITETLVKFLTMATFSLLDWLWKHIGPNPFKIPQHIANHKKTSFITHIGIQLLMQNQLLTQEISNPRDPGSLSENGFMEPKYLAFRRWLYTPCSSSEKLIGSLGKQNPEHRNSCQESAKLESNKQIPLNIRVWCI